MFGASRYGPLAPFTCQFGKYDSLISTGLPTSDTSNEILSTVVFTLLTTGGLSIACACAVARSAAFTRGQLFGPVCAYGVSSSPGFVHHGAVVHSQPPSTGSGVEGSGFGSPQHFV